MRNNHPYRANSSRGRFVHFTFRPWFFAIVLVLAMLMVGWIASSVGSKKRTPAVFQVDVAVDRHQANGIVKRVFVLDSSRGRELVYRLYVEDVVKSESGSTGRLGNPPEIIEELDPNEDVAAGAASVALGDVIDLVENNERTLWQVRDAEGQMWRATLEVVQRR